MITVGYRIDLTEVIAMLDGYIDRLSKPKEFMQGVADIMRQDVFEQFQQGGIPRWVPLKPSTVKAKRQMGYPRLSRTGTVNPGLLQRGNFGPENILERTGALLSSWTDKNDPHHYEQVTDDSATIGSDLVYAATHQFGLPKKGIPRRPVTITDQALKKIETLAKRRLLEEAR